MSECPICMHTLRADGTCPMDTRKVRYDGSLLTTVEAAAFLGLKPPKFRFLDLPHIKESGRFLYSRADLEAYREAR